MENKKALKLIDKVTTELTNAGIITEGVVEDLKALRPYAVDEKRPVVAKSLRLAYEHIEENEVFVIPIPQDEPLEDESEDNNEELITGAESLAYLLHLVKKSDLEINIEELREYNRKFEAFAE